MKRLEILSLNCQKGYNHRIKGFLLKVLESSLYDFILLQEADATVLSMIEGVGPYKILGAFNREAGQESHLRIVYRENFTLRESHFISFSKMDERFAHRGELGFLTGLFDCGEDAIVMGSLHLHPGFPFYLRAREMELVKAHLKRLLSSKKIHDPIIFGGDLNLAFPWEGAYMRSVLGFGFREITLDIGTTLDGRYTEKGTHLASKIGNVLAGIGVDIKFKTDRIFVDKIISDHYESKVRVLPDRVSDHSPIREDLRSYPNPGRTEERVGRK